MSSFNAPHRLRVVGGSQAGRPMRQVQLIEKLCEHALPRLTGALGSVLGRVDDALFDFMQHAGQREDSTRYIDAMRVLRLRRENIERRFQADLGGAFAALLRGDTVCADWAVANPDNSELSLVSEEELEVQLAAKQLAESLGADHGQVVAQLNQRIGWLAGGIELDANTNPIGPGHVAAAIHAATQNCEVPLHVKLILFKLCERELGTGLEDAYHGINQWLIGADVLPELPRLRQRFAVRRQPAPKPAAAEAAPAAPEVVSEAQAREMFNALHLLLSHYRSVHFGPSIMPGEDMRALHAQEMVDVLSLLQTEISPGLRTALENPGASLAQRVKAEVLAGAASLGLDPAQTRLDPLDEDAIDLVGMLFEVLLDEREIAGKARSLVGRLVVPYVKVALLDRKMFLRKTHPARRLLNAIAEACENNHAETPAERALLEKAESIIERLVAEFNENLAIFEMLLEEFSAFLDQHRKRVELVERRAAEAQQGRERLEQARERVAAELAERMTGRELPPSLELVLKTYWSHHLLVTSLREGEGSDRYRAGLVAGDALIACLDEAHCGMSGLLATLPTLRSELDPVLASSGCVGESAATIVRAVTDELRKIARGDIPAPVPEPAVAAAVPPPLHAQSELESAREEPVLRLVSDRDAMDFDPADIERLRDMPLGTWVELSDAEGKRQAVKLAWVSPISSRLMFVNRRGMRMCVASVEELAVLMKQGRLALRPVNSAFERAMHQVLGRLREPAAA